MAPLDTFRAQLRLLYSEPRLAMQTSRTVFLQLLSLVLSVSTGPNSQLLGECVTSIYCEAAWHDPSSPSPEGITKKPEVDLGVQLGSMVTTNIAT